MAISLFAKSDVPVTTGVLSLVNVGASMLTVGACVSTTPPFSVSLAVLPAASVTLASTWKAPSARGVGTSTDQVPSASTVAVKVCTAPFASVTVRLTIPPISSLLPVMVGVVSLVSANGSISKLGACVSITPPFSLSVAVLPAASVTLASTWNAPSARGVGTSTDQVPSANTVAVRFCTVPFASVTAIVTVPPISSLLPVMVGVVSLVAASGSISKLGACVSITPPFSLSDAVLPAASVILASTWNAPSARGVGTSTDQVPSANTVAVKVCTAPFASVTAIVTIPPISSLLPVMVGVVSLVAASGSISKLGACVSITPPFSLSDAVLPAASVMLASTWNAPSASGVGTSTDQVPSASTVAVKVCTAPFASVTAIVTIPPISSLLPVMVGVVSLVSANGSISKLGACVSITPPFSLSVAVLPAASVMLASTWNAPSASGVGTSTAQVPSANTVAVKICTAPVASVTVRLTTPPISSLLPVMVGVVSLVAASGSISKLGACVSITPPFSLSDAVLPAASVMLASTWNAPSARGVSTSTAQVPSANTVAVKVCTAPVASVTVRLTIPPISSLLPVMVGVVSLVAASGSISKLGACVSITPPFSVSLAVLPAASVMLASTWNAPSASGVGTSTAQVPSASTVAVKVCTAPVASVTVRLTIPPISSLLPVMAGVVSLVAASGSISKLGACVSITPPFSVSLAVLPAASVILASTWNAPSASGVGTSTAQVPSANTVAVKVCTAPFASVTAIVTIPPISSLLPVMVGVVSLVAASGSISKLGACVSITPPFSVSLAILPAASVTLASTWNAPSARGVGTSTDQVPSASTVAVKVCTAPFASVTAIVTIPPISSLLPVMVGVVSLVSASGLISKTGAWVSITPIACASLVKPSTVTLAATVNCPSATVFCASTLQTPAVTVVVRVWLLLLLSVITTVIMLPSGASDAPLIVGVTSLLSAIASMLRLGALSFKIKLLFAVA
ncbi:hypothetical protein PSMA108079_11735 [Pseudoalteromonas mariniglutinosa]